VPEFALWREETLVRFKDAKALELWRRWRSEDKSPKREEEMGAIKRWAEAMEAKMSWGHGLEDVATKTSIETGAMEVCGNGSATETLRLVWKHGEDLHQIYYPSGPKTGVEMPRMEDHLTVSQVDVVRRWFPFSGNRVGEDWTIRMVKEELLDECAVRSCPECRRVREALGLEL
jgi:hypothetical protein